MCISRKKPKAEIRMLRKPLIVTILALSIGGCANLPDFSGYTTATDQLRQSVKSAGDAVATEIDLTSSAFKESGGDSSTITRIENSKAEFEKHWGYRNGAMTAVVEYTNSLEEITTAGKQGAESAKAVGDSIEGLLKTIGVVPGAQLAGVAAETIEKIYGEVAKVRAQNSLEQSLREAGPIIEEIVTIIERDTKSLETSFEIALNAQLSQLKRENEPLQPGGEREELLKLRTYRDKALLDELKYPASTGHADKVKGLMSDISIIDNRISILNAEWTAYNDSFDEIQKRRRVGMGLIQASSKALGAWKSAHNKLASAIKQKKTPSIQEVVATANDIQELVRKWGEL
ncbi:MAG: hypothetical protein KJ717_11420 [Proteobacteria bacterium]|nr:hypothetical protein [Pseudomonadota bacterium]